MSEPDSHASGTPSEPPTPRGIEPEVLLRLREAGADELAALVGELGPRLDPPAARAVLRNPYLTAEVAESVAQPRLIAFYEVRRDLVMNPRTPEPLARNLVPGLFWRDLAAVGRDTRLHPRLRRAADLALAARLPGLAVGEKISLARAAGPGLLAELRHDASPRVIAALLDNPRLTEGTLVPVAGSPETPAPVLALIASDRRWGVRHGVLAALCRNPATPVAAALRLLPMLRKPELKAVASDPRLSDAVRRRARVLLGEGD